MSEKQSEIGIGFEHDRMWLYLEQPEDRTPKSSRMTLVNGKMFTLNYVEGQWELTSEDSTHIFTTPEEANVYLDALIELERTDDTFEASD